MLKIFQARLQQHVNCELPDVQASFRKGRGTRGQAANIHRIIEKAREFHKNIYFCFIDYAKALDRVDHHKLWKILQEMGIPDHLTCLLWNLYAGQEAVVGTGHGAMDWFQIGKGVCQGRILSHCLFNLHAEYIMRNAGLDEAQAGKRFSREVSITWYSDDTTLMAESEELKILLMKVKEESEKVGLKLNSQKTKIMASGPISSVQFTSVVQLCLTLGNPMNCSMPGLPVHHQLPEFTQTHVHRVGDAIQPSHPLSSPSPPAPYPSQHQSLFQWVNSSHEVAKVLEFQLQHQSFQWTPRTHLL